MGRKCVLLFSNALSSGGGVSPPSATWGGVWSNMTCSILYFHCHSRLEHHCYWISIHSFGPLPCLSFVNDNIQVSAWPGTAPGAPGGAPAVSGTYNSMLQYFLLMLQQSLSLTQGGLGKHQGEEPQEEAGQEHLHRHQEQLQDLLLLQPGDHFDIFIHLH